MIADFDPTRAVITWGGQPLAGFEPDTRITVNPSPLKPAFSMTLKADAPELDRLLDVARRDLPVPVLICGRRRPRRRHHARGGLRRMVRSRMSLTMQGLHMEGGVDKPWTFTADCVLRSARGAT